MDINDHALLNELSDALGRNPFAATVTVAGVKLTRPTARALERQLLRLRVSERHGHSAGL